MKEEKRNNQIVGNMGLFYVCHHLSKLGWNVLLTSRNTRGVDVVIYSTDGSQKHTIQVKTLSKRVPVPLGKNLSSLAGDFLIICRNVHTSPECFVMTPDEVRKFVHTGEKEGRVTYWLQPKQYDNADFKEKWERIGQ